MNSHLTSGVCVHSMQSTYETYIIFCVGQSLVRQQAFKEWALEAGIPYKELRGMYKGQPETSFIVNDKYRNDVFPWYMNEESILVLYPSKRSKGYFYRPCQLVTPILCTPLSGVMRFWPKNREWALKQDAWTYDPTTDQYYVAQ